MKLALLGYGKMGREIENLAIERGHEICVKIDHENEWAIAVDLLSCADMAIDFSTPESALSNIRRCFDAGIPLVEGTTGWHDHLPQIRQECLSRDQSLFWAPNFSIGVNLFFELNRMLATLMSNYPEYEIALEETHHIHKKDAPSGTAIVLANDIIQNHRSSENWVRETAGKPGDIPIHSHRVEEVTGTHRVMYESPDDRIEIIHTANNRKGFARGAIIAAEWLKGKKGFYEMKDLIGSLQKNYPGE